MLTFIKHHWFILLYLSLYFIAINLVVLNRFWQYEALYFDHGIFDSSLWLVAHGKLPLIDHLGKSFISQTSDHFTPTMYLLSPIYWFTQAYEPLLIIENLFVVLSAWVLYLIAKEKIRFKLMIFAIIFAYTFFIGLQNAIIANFHTELVALFTLSLTLSFLNKNRWHFFFIFLFLTLGLKEGFAIIGIFFGIYIFIVNKKVGVFTSLFCAIYYFLVTRFLIPSYSYETTSLGNLFLPLIKTETMLISFATFGFLPLGAIAFLPTIFQDFILRFVLNTGSARWDLGMHYNATLAVLLTFGTIMSASRLNKRWAYLFAVLIFSTTAFFHRFKYHGPIGLVTNSDFYHHTQNLKFVANYLQKIPKNTLVMTNNNLAAYLTHTNQVMLPRGNYYDFMPEIIALDYRSGQNPVNFWPANELAVKNLVENVRQNNNYEIMYENGDQIIFKKYSLP